MNRSQASTGLLLGLLAFSVQARVHNYVAPLDESTWVQEGSAVQCELRHQIPQYGEAVFSQGVDEDLKFAVRVIRTPRNKDTEATVQSAPPEWKHDLPTRDLGTVEISKSSQPFNMGRDMARRLMLELEDGMFPTFYYSDWADGKDEVNVAISSVNFAKARKDFVTCLAGLLPYGFKDIRFSHLNFAHAKASLSSKVKRRLDAIAKYIVAAPDEVIVDIEGHTDARGFRRYNEVLSMRRAKAVQAYLKAKGVKSSQMMISGFGERKPIASNRTKKGREKNRRVVVSLAK